MERPSLVLGAGCPGTAIRMTCLCRVETPQLALVLDTAGRLRVLDAPEQGREYLRASEQEARPLFTVRTAAGDVQSVRRWSFSAQGEGSGIRMHGTVEGVELAVAVTFEGSGCIWDVRLANRGVLPLDALRFQLAGPLRVGSAPCVTYPFNSGWRLPLSALAPDEALVLHYPVHAAMQWLDLYSAEHGLYLGVRDPLPYSKTLLLGKQGPNPFLAVEFPDLHLRQGEALDLPPIHVALHRGDWKAGADLYRSWAQEHVSDPDVPAWYARQPAWNWTFFRHQHASTPTNHAADLPRISAQTAAFGPQLVQLTAYTEHGHDTGYPDYVVGSSHGGDKGMARAVAEVHAAGRYVSIYTNGRLVDPASSVTHSQRESWGVRTEAGARVWQETYGQVTFDVMCPSVQAWSDLFVQRLAHLVERYDVDGIYVDQVCGCTSLPCYAPGHGHTRPNAAWAGYRPFMRALRQALRAIKPGLYLATEGVNDLLGQYFDSQQGHEDWARQVSGRGQVMPELYRYTFPRHLINVGCIRGNQHTYLRLGHTLGSGFDFGIAEPGDLEPAYVRAARWALERRREYDALFREGVFHPQLVTDRDGCRANAFWRGGTLLIAAAWLPAEDAPPPATVEILAPWPPGVQAVEARCSSPRGDEQCQVGWSGEALRVQIPGRDLALVCLQRRSK